LIVNLQLPTINNQQPATINQQRTFSVMKNNIIPFFFLFLLLAACNRPPQDKAARLEELKKQHDALQAEITALEKELGTGGGGAQRVRTVSLTEVQLDTFQHFIDLQGRVEAENNVPVTSKIPGVLTRVLVENGDAVRKGQLLAQIDNEVMRSGLTELEVQLRTATDLYNRQKALWDQKIGTEVQYIQAKTQMEALQQRLATTRQQIGQAGIYAPIGGTVDMVMLKAGQAISPGFPLCNIVNLSKLKIKGEVPEAYAAKVAQGDPVVVFFPDINKEVRTRVTYVSKTINPTNRTFSVECSLPAGKEYRANMVAVMKIVDYQNLKAVTVPVNVIQTGDEGEYVLTAEKTGEKTAVARKTPVRQGNNYNGLVEIRSGLKAGDLIITSGYQDVNNGETIAF
jgi:membrane fusion protein (multidrug efflux system)